MRELIDATLIVVNYNKMLYTRLCLESVLAADPVPRQVIAIDNGSTDGTRTYLQHIFPFVAARVGVKFTLIPNHSNVGACTARNQGLSLATGRYIIFSDNDVCVRTRRWLRILVDVLESDENIGIVGPKLVFPFPPYNIQPAGAAISRSDSAMMNACPLSSAPTPG